MEVVFPLLSPESKMPWSPIRAIVVASLLSSLCPSCPLQAGVHTIKNTSQVLLLCPNFPRVWHLIKSETESFCCGCRGLLGPTPYPCLPYLAWYILIPLRTLSSSCFPLSTPYLPQNLSTYIFLLLEHYSSRYPPYLLLHFIPISVQIALSKKGFCGHAI